MIEENSCGSLKENGSQRVALLEGVAVLEEVCSQKVAPVPPSSEVSQPLIK